MPRKKGTKNKRTEMRIKAIKASGKTPLEFLLDVFRDEGNSLQVRMQAARDAMPYVHARMPQVNLNANHDAKNKELTDYLDSELNAFLSKATGTESSAGSETGTDTAQKSTPDTSGLH